MFTAPVTAGVNNLAVEALFVAAIPPAGIVEIKSTTDSQGVNVLKELPGFL